MISSPLGSITSVDNRSIQYIVLSLAMGLLLVALGLCLGLSTGYYILGIAIPLYIVVCLGFAFPVLKVSPILAFVKLILFN